MLNRRELLKSAVLCIPGFSLIFDKTIFSEFGLGKYVTHNISQTHYTPALLTPGEFVLSKEQYSKYLPLPEIKSSLELQREGLYELGRKGIYYRYVNFPIENKLTIHYTLGYEEYLCYNAKIETINKINIMSIQELIKYKNCNNFIIDKLEIKLSQAIQLNV